jgi:hypothetical protein
MSMPVSSKDINYLDTFLGLLKWNAHCSVNNLLYFTNETSQWYGFHLHYS